MLHLFVEVRFTFLDIKVFFEFRGERNNGQIFDQIDGVAMGSPLAPLLANLFMGYHEKN